MTDRIPTVDVPAKAPELNGQKISSLILSDGTIMEREGNRFVVNPGTSRQSYWHGDIRYGADGTPQFVNAFEKFPNQVNLEVILPDGRRIVLNDNGTNRYFGAFLGLGPESIEQTASRLAKELNLDADVVAQRLRLAQVGKLDDSITTRYSLQLTKEEAASVEGLVTPESKFRFANAGEEVQTHPIPEELKPISRRDGTIPGETPGEYVYARPMPDHTATTVYFFEDGGELYVVLGQRGKEPFKGQDGLLGGFGGREKNVGKVEGKLERVEQSGGREISEETTAANVTPHIMRVSDALKDERNRIIDYQMVYFGSKEQWALMKAKDDVSRLSAIKVAEVLKANALAFDHTDALRFAVFKMAVEQPQSAVLGRIINDLSTSDLHAVVNLLNAEAQFASSAQVSSVLAKMKETLAFREQLSRVANVAESLRILEVVQANPSLISKENLEGSLWRMISLANDDEAKALLTSIEVLNTKIKQSNPRINVDTEVLAEAEALLRAKEVGSKGHFADQIGASIENLHDEVVKALSQTRQNLESAVSDLKLTFNDLQVVRDAKISVEQQAQAILQRRYQLTGEYQNSTRVLSEITERLKTLQDGEPFYKESDLNALIGIAKFERSKLGTILQIPDEASEILERMQLEQSSQFTLFAREALGERAKDLQVPTGMNAPRVTRVAIPKEQTLKEFFAEQRIKLKQALDKITAMEKGVQRNPEESFDGFISRIASERAALTGENQAALKEQLRERLKSLVDLPAPSQTQLVDLNYSLNDLWMMAVAAQNSRIPVIGDMYLSLGLTTATRKEAAFTYQSKLLRPTFEKPILQKDQINGTQVVESASSLTKEAAPATDATATQANRRVSLEDALNSLRPSKHWNENIHKDLLESIYQKQSAHYARRSEFDDAVKNYLIAQLRANPGQDKNVLVARIWKAAHDASDPLNRQGYDFFNLRGMMLRTELEFADSLGDLRLKWPAIHEELHELVNRGVPENAVEQKARQMAGSDYYYRPTKAEIEDMKRLLPEFDDASAIEFFAIFDRNDPAWLRDRSRLATDAQQMFRQIKTATDDLNRLKNNHSALVREKAPQADIDRSLQVINDKEIDLKVLQVQHAMMQKEIYDAGVERFNLIRTDFDQFLKQRNLTTQLAFDDTTQFGGYYQNLILTIASKNFLASNAYQNLPFLLFHELVHHHQLISSVRLSIQEIMQRRLSNLTHFGQIDESMVIKYMSDIKRNLAKRRNDLLTDDDVLKVLRWSSDAPFITPDFADFVRRMDGDWKLNSLNSTKSEYYRNSARVISSRMIGMEGRYPGVIEEAGADKFIEELLIGSSRQSVIETGMLKKNTQGARLARQMFGSRKLPREILNILREESEHFTLGPNNKPMFMGYRPISELPPEVQDFTKTSLYYDLARLMERRLKHRIEQADYFNFLYYNELKEKFAYGLDATLRDHTQNRYNQLTGS